MAMIMITGLSHYAAYLFNRWHRGSDGKVPYERVEDKRPTVLGVEFGERVRFKRKLGSKQEQLGFDDLRRSSYLPALDHFLPHLERLPAPIFGKKWNPSHGVVVLVFLLEDL